MIFVLLEVRELIDNVGYRYIIINKDYIELKENDSKQVINVAYKKVFNTVLGLFLLAKEWENNELNEGRYEISFNFNSEYRKYCFNETPKNWLLFKSYLGVLVGDNYE